MVRELHGDSAVAASRLLPIEVAQCARRGREARPAYLLQPPLPTPAAEARGMASAAMGHIYFGDRG